MRRDADLFGVRDYRSGIIKQTYRGMNWKARSFPQISYRDFTQIKLVFMVGFIVLDWSTSGHNNQHKNETDNCNKLI